MNTTTENKQRLPRLLDRLVICVFSWVWRKRLAQYGSVYVVAVKGWRTALVQGRLVTRERRTFLFKFLTGTYN